MKVKLLKKIRKELRKKITVNGRYWTYHPYGWREFKKSKTFMAESELKARIESMHYAYRVNRETILAEFIYGKKRRKNKDSGV